MNKRVIKRILSDDLVEPIRSHPKGFDWGFPFDHYILVDNTKIYGVSEHYKASDVREYIRDITPEELRKIR